MTQFRILMPPIVPVKEKGEGIKNKLTFSSDKSLPNKASIMVKRRGIRKDTCCH